MSTALPTDAGFAIRRLTSADADAFRAIRLEALAASPDAFEAAVEDEGGHDLAWFAARLDATTVLGAWTDKPETSAGALAGIVGLYVQAPAKTRHKGVVWGMYIRPQARGTGLGAALMRGLIDHAADQVTDLMLWAMTHNTGAIRLYRSVGFREAGIEPRALKVGERFYDAVLMVRELTPS